MMTVNFEPGSFEVDLQVNQTRMEPLNLATDVYKVPVWNNQRCEIQRIAVWTLWFCPTASISNPLFARCIAKAPKSHKTML